MMEKRNKKILMISIIFVGLLLTTSTMFSTEYIISGYGGIESIITGIHTPYTVEENIDIRGTTASIDPLMTGPFTNPTGLRMETQGMVNIGTPSKWKPDVNKTVDNGDGTYTHTLVKAAIVPCTVNIAVITEPVGLDTINDVTFDVTFKENAFDVFGSADEVHSFILEIYTTAVFQSDYPANMKGVPAAAGEILPMYPSPAGRVPSWILEAGYQETLESLKVVTIKLEVDSATPTSFLGGFRGDVVGTWSIGLDVLCFGMWEEIGENRDWVSPVSDPSVFDSLIAALAGILPALGIDFNSIIIMVIIAGVGYLIIRLVVVERLKKSGRKR